MYLIDAEALEKEGWYINRIIQKNKNTMEYQTRKPTEFHAIESECKTGKWVKHNYNLLICSNCGCPAPAITTGSLVNRHREQIPSSYCWNCGAKMNNEKTV